MKNGYEKIIELLERFRNATRKAFEERIQTILESPVKEIPVDGGYSALTVQVIIISLLLIFDFNCVDY